MKACKSLPHFRGVFMRDQLPKKPFKYEKGVLNLDESKNSGTHWTGYVKEDKKVFYFNSYGNLQPPPEFIRYMKGNKILYNYEKFQKFNSIHCGQLTVWFLNNFSKYPFIYKYL